MSSSGATTLAARDAESVAEAPRPSTRWGLAALSLAVLLASLGTSVANVGLPSLAASFDASFRQVQWIVLAYLLAMSSSIVSAGRLGDMIGRRRSLSLGLVLFTLATAGCGLAPSLGVLLVGRAVQGLGAALMMALTVALVGDLMPKEKTGRAMGLLGTMSATGTALGPSLGGALIGWLGWRAIFFVQVPLGAVGLYLTHRHLAADRVTEAPNRAGFDYLGTAVLGLTLAAYALAMTVGPSPFAPLGLALLLSAALGVALFVVVEARAPTPLIRMAMLRAPKLSRGLVTSALVATVMMATLVVGPFYLSRSLALDAARVGLVLSAGPLVAALTGAPAGRFVDRFGTERTSIVGLLAMAAGASLLAILPPRLGVLGYLAPMVVLTAGYAQFQASNNTAVMADVRADQRGVIGGMLNLSRNLGLITGASVMGAVFAFSSSAVDVATAGAAALATGTRGTFAVATGLILVALGVAVIRLPSPAPLRDLPAER